jgi:hypothetical protein
VDPRLAAYSFKTSDNPSPRPDSVLIWGKNFAPLGRSTSF